MSRAVCIDANRADVIAMCRKHAMPISVIEPIGAEGTRVVLRNSHDAAILAKAYGGRILAGAVTRTSLRPRQVL